MDDVLFSLLFRSRPSFVRPSSGDQTKNRLFIGDSSNFGRDEATRTPDPYVPNVVRYQLRYIPIALRDSLQKPAYFQKSRCKGSAFLWIKQIFQEKVMICQIFVVPLHTDKKMVP